MRIKAIAGVTATALLAGWMGTAQAGSVTLTPDQATIAVGQTVTFDYNMDFTDDPTIGGGTDFYYDTSVLQFVGWSFDVGFTDDSAFARRGPDDCAGGSADPGCGHDPDAFGVGLGQINGMSFGNFDGLAGPYTVGQLVFTAVGLGSTTIFMDANDDGVAGNPGEFYSAQGNNDLQNVTFNNGQVTVAAPIPVPAAVWMMLGGLGALGGLRRRNA